MPMKDYVKKLCINYPLKNLYLRRFDWGGHLQKNIEGEYISNF